MRQGHIHAAIFVPALLLLLSPGIAGSATIDGRVIHPTRPGAGAGLTVILMGLAKEGEAFENSTTTDGAGRFRFADLRQDAVYLLGATYDGIPFSGGSVVFDKDQDRRSLVFHVYDRTEDLGGASIRKVRWLIEREAGIYRIQQTTLVHNPSLRVIVADEASGPLLRIGLPSNRGDLEAPFGRLPDGARIADGVLELRGPIFPGDREFQVAYDVASTGDTLETELRLEESTAEVELLIRDFGIVVDAGALHPAKPARKDDSIYIRYLGFDLAPETRLPLRVEPLSPRAAAPFWLEVLLAAGIASGLGLFVLGPIDRRTDSTDRPREEGEVAREDPEREAIVAALRDLDFDHETGKISSEDRDRLRAELRREAVQAMARARRATGADEPAPLACVCGHVARPGDRFCASCGKSL